MYILFRFSSFIDYYKIFDIPPCAICSTSLLLSINVYKCIILSLLYSVHLFNSKLYVLLNITYMTYRMAITSSP